MTSKLLSKRSAVPGKVPTTAQIDLGELAINTRDGKLFLKRDNGNGTFTIVELGTVRSVAGKTGEVILTAADVGLGQVNNTADRDKPVSTAMQTALEAKVSGSRRIETGIGFKGGGDLGANRTIAADIASLAEARAGAAVEKLMSAASVEQHMLANAIGWGQTWSQANRQGGIEYINETGRPILISYYDTSSSQCRLSGAAPSAAWTMIAAARYGVSATAIIPAGWRYMFSYTPDYVAILM
jgi:hypothetical protein